MFSIYHFFRTLVINKDNFVISPTLEAFPFDVSMFSCQNKGQFPDLAIKISPNNSLFTGGELIELKDSSYIISSFNSTIPTGKKAIDSIIKTPNSRIKQQMEQAGDNIFSLIRHYVKNKSWQKNRI